MRARIYSPARNAMQSGTAKTGHWVLDYAPEPKTVDPLMGWTGTHNPEQQIRMSFESREAAISYAEKNGIAYVVQDAQSRAPNVRKGGYGENFATNRRGAWTH